jgi:hypothetical protein
MATKVHRSVQNLGLKLFNFMSTYWCPEFGSGSYIFGKFDDTYF